MNSKPIACSGVRACYLLAFFCLFLDSDAVAQEKKLDRFVTWSFQDAGALARVVLPRIPAYSIVGFAALSTGARIDEPFQDEVMESYENEKFFRSYLNFTNEIGSSNMRLPVAGFFAATLLTNNHKLQDAAFTSFQTLIYSNVMTLTLKHTFGRHRPDENAGAFRFEPLSRHSSFPSGHVTTAVAIITPWVLYYPGPVTYSLFALSAGTALARMGLNKHWPTDVLAGAAIGFFTGRFLTHRHQQKIPSRNVNISTSATANSIVFTARW